MSDPNYNTIADAFQTLSVEFRKLAPAPLLYGPEAASESHPLTAAEFAELGQALDAEAQAGGSVEQFLEDNPPAAEFTPYVYKPESGGLRAHWKPDADWLESTYERYGILLFHSLKTNEVIGCQLAPSDHSVDAADRNSAEFRCPKCGSRGYGDCQDGAVYCIRGDGIGCGWSGHWSEVEAAAGMMADLTRPAPGWATRERRLNAIARVAEVARTHNIEIVRPKG